MFSEVSVPEITDSQFTTIFANKAPFFSDLFLFSFVVLFSHLSILKIKG